MVKLPPIRGTINDYSTVSKFYFTINKKKDVTPKY